MQNIDTQTLNIIEQALGFELYDWQKQFILECRDRRNGKTLTNILNICLSDGKPMLINMNTMTIFENCELLRFAGDDGCTLARLRFFIKELKNVYDTLKRYDEGIPLRDIRFIHSLDYYNNMRYQND